ncbi:hypothetical protein [Mycolicibacterium chlorophenolicum]|uniref:Secreted protein n=1 Tax=Mycolicibacterium chlorophenolicum TaxID=37916 RepID=A0A0J6VQP6_9MYCO|nr:hypothetical protein [Mycolicibacterium chlorophenolicum]KMO71802.1 hypothetical protein MCHLDSM_04394 [Mycolicibacterium chlorophenolicum]
MTISPRNGLAGCVLVLGALCTSGTATAGADDGPPLHQVTYTVSTDHPLGVGIYYRDVDPPTWADYSHDPYRYSPRDDIHLEPGAPWVHQAMLADPGRWAMVTVTAAGPPTEVATTLRCQMSVDGVEVDHAEGPRGALCSMRNW